MADKKIDIPEDFFTKMAEALGAKAPEAEVAPPVEESVAKAAGDELAEIRKAVDTLTEQVASLTSALAVAQTEEEEDGPVVKAVRTAAQDNEVVKEVLDGVLDRVQALEEGTAVRKSLSGQEGAPVRKSADQTLDEFVRGMAATAIRR